MTFDGMYWPGLVAMFIVVISVPLLLIFCRFAWLERRSARRLERAEREAERLAHEGMRFQRTEHAKVEEGL